MSEQLPKGWTRTKLQQLCARGAPIIYGILQPGPEVAEGVPYVRPTEIRDDVIQLDEVRRTTAAIAARYARASLREGDVLLSIVGTIGKVALVPAALDGGNITQSSVRIRPAAAVDGRFLRLLLKSPTLTRQFEKCRLGTGVPRLNVAHVRELECPLPPLKEQRRIVAKLDTLQARSRRAREGLDAVPPLLEKLRQSILAAAFRGDLTKDWRAKNSNVEPATKLLERIRAERRKKWEDSELGKMKAKGKLPTDDRWRAKYKVPEVTNTTGLQQLPEGWCWTSLGEVFEICVGATPSRAQPAYWDGSIPWVSSGEVAFCRIRTTRESITERGLADSSTRMHPPGTVLLGMIGEGKTRGQVAILDIDACNNQNAAAIRVAATPIPPEYVYRFLEYEYERTRRVGSGNNQQALNKARVEAICMPVAPLAEQVEIQSRVDELLGVADRLTAMRKGVSDSAGALERAVLAKAFRGELLPQDPTDEPADVTLARTASLNGAASRDSTLAPVGGRRRSRSRQSRGVPFED